MRSIYIIPHCGLGGGAGIFIQDYIEDLRGVGFELNGMGKYKDDYNLDNIYTELNTINTIIIPYYKGVSVFSTFYWIIVSIFNFPFIFFKVKNFFIVNKIEEIILTSSIQLPLAPLLKIISRNVKITILIQENLKISGFLQFFIKFCLRKCNYIKSVSNSWAIKNSEIGFRISVLKNKFNSRNIFLSAQKIYDLIYVGGDSNIKGFGFIVKALKILSIKRKFKIVFVGFYSNKNLLLLQKLIKILELRGSTLELVGHVKDIGPLLNSAKVLLLPIQAYHFCRPAVEAGFYSIPFILPRLEGADDFAYENFNCLCYSPNNVFEFIKCIDLLIVDKELYKRLAFNNYQNSLKFISNNNQIYSSKL